MPWVQSDGSVTNPMVERKSQPSTNGVAPLGEALEEGERLVEGLIELDGETLLDGDTLGLT